jgi:hypothetical protein
VNLRQGRGVNLLQRLPEAMAAHKKASNRHLRSIWHRDRACSRDPGLPDLSAELRFPPPRFLVDG